jgi:hypothetical protein
MRKKLLLISAIIMCLIQVSIGQTDGVLIDYAGGVKDDKAVFQLNATDKGFLVPRVSLLSNGSPVTGTKPVGLMVFNVGGGFGPDGFYYWNGSTWIMVATGTGGTGYIQNQNASAQAANYWISGTSNSQGGYTSTSNPWGTSNSAFFPNGITTAATTNWIYGSTNYIGNAPSNGYGHQFNAASGNSSAWLAIGGGNVGIGTTSPGWTLDVIGNARVGANTGQNTLAALAVSAGQGSATTFRDIDLHGSWAANEGHAITASHATGASNIVGQIVFEHNSPGSRIKFGRLYHSGDQTTYPMELVSNGSNAILRMNNDAYDYFGPNSTWGAYLQVGGNGRVTTGASVAATNGNLHIDAANGGFATYINYYSANNTYINGAGANVGIGNTAGSAKLHVSGGGQILGTNGTSSNTRTLTILEDGDAQTNFGSYPGAWTSALQIQSNDPARYIWLSPISTGGNARMVSIGSDFEILPGNTLASTFYSSGDVTTARYHNAQYFNSSDNSVGSGVTGVMIKAGDNYLRTGTAAAVATFLNGTTTGPWIPNNGSGDWQIASSSTSTSYSVGSLELRESNFSGAGGTPPHLGMHWGGVVASNITIEGSGRIAIRDNPGTGYENFIAKDIVSYSYSGYGNVGGTGSASWHPSGIYSAGYNWLYGGINGGGGSATNFGDVRANIFYDYQNTGYYVDPNGTSEMNVFTRGTLARSSLNALQDNSPVTTRAAQGDAYRNGSMGWGQIDFNVMTNWGSGFIDSWSNPANAPGGSSHYTGIQSMHHTSQNSYNFYGFQMVTAGESANRYFLRNSWNVPRPWVEMIHTGNIGSYGDNLGNHTATTTLNMNGSAITNSANVYTSGWFRNTTNLNGLYNEAVGAHFYASAANIWNMGGGGTYPQLIFRDNHQSTIRGYVYSDGSGFGLLHSGGGWAIRTNPGMQELYDDTYMNRARPYITYDRDDASYYTDLNTWSRMWGVGTFYVRNNYDVTTDHPFGMYFANGMSTDYAIYRESGGWGYPYPDLRISFHTGIKLGAHWTYGGTRFYNNSDMATLIFSVGDGDNYTRVTSNGGSDGIAMGQIHGDNTNTIQTYIDGQWANRASYAGGCCNPLLLQPDVGMVAIGTGSANLGYKLHVNGNVLCTTLRSNGFIEPSDARLKVNIKPLGGALNKIMAMQGVTYNWNKELEQNKMLTDKLQYGLIAQELEKIIPELINTDEEGWKGIEYSHLVPVLIEALKEQQQTIENQKQLITGNTDDITFLKNYTKELEAKINTIAADKTATGNK